MKTALQLFTFPAPSSRGCCNRQASRMQVRAWARYRSGCYRTHRPAPGVTRRGAADSSPAAARPALRRRGVTKPHPAWKLKINPAGQPMGLLMGWFCRSGSPKPLPARLPDTLWAMNSMLRNTHEPKAYAFLYINVRIWKSRAGRSTPPCTPRTGRAGQARGWGGGGARQSPALGGELSPAARPAPALPPAPPAPPLGGPARPRRPRRRRPAPAPLGPSPPSERRRAGRRLPPTPRLLHWQPPGIPTIARLLGASSRSPPRPHRPGPARPFAVTLRGAAFQARPGKAAGGRACCRLAEREDPVGSEATLSV